ncbi:MAG: response regulator [Lachnospiraceae bacterium]|nr:response regulator [Lachnospiraceae bacterium]
MGENKRKKIKITNDYTKANDYTLKTMIAAMIVMALSWILNVLHVFIIDQRIMNIAFIGMAVFVVLGYIVKYSLGFEKTITNYVMLTLLVAMFTFANVEVAYHGTLFMIFPIVCAVLYDDSKYKTYAFWLTVAGLAVSVLVGFNFGLCDSNMLIFTTSTTKNTILMLENADYDLTPKMTDIALFFVFPRCMALAAFNVVLNSIKNNIMEKTKREQESRRFAEEEMIANQAKSVFLANMSHEIRTPINTVLGLDTMILRESEDEEIRKYALDIQSAGESLLSIINDILDFSKIESGKMEIIPVDYDSSNLINDVVNMIAPKAEAKKLRFNLNVENDLPSVLHGDDVRIRQVLVNLLTNAVKYTEKGEVSLTVKRELSEDGVNIFFSVKDTGIGIAKENIDKLFLKFVRIDESRNRNIEGTGLGINIVTMLLDLMGSELKVESEYGKGSNFYFTIKQGIVDARPVGNINKRREKAAKNFKYKVKYKIPDVRLLVVDDNAMNRKVFTSLLKAFECKIDEAENGEIALNLVKEYRYDIIFMDHMMPGKDGVETFHEMRKLEGSLNNDTPVVILTANAVSGARESYMAEGFDDFLSKPINPEKLEAMVSLMISDDRKIKQE